jgi:hypothetical protein
MPNLPAIPSLKPFPETATDPITQALSGVRRTLARPAALRSSVTFCVPEVKPIAQNPLEKSTPIPITPRTPGRIKWLSESRRIDLMLLPAMLWRLFSYGASDGTHDEAEVFRNLLADAMVEPVNGEGWAKAEKLGNRVQKEAKLIMDEYFAGQPNARVGMIIFFSVQIMLDEGRIELTEGSAMADALFQLHDMCVWYMEKDPAIERSMRKAARKFADMMHRRGYFR